MASKSPGLTIGSSEANAGSAGSALMRSTHGEMHSAPAGSATARSRNARRSDITSPPPAESPPTTIRVGSITAMSAT